MVGVHVAKGDVAGGGVNPFGALHCTEYAGATVKEDVGRGGRGAVLSCAGSRLADNVARRGAVGSLDASGASQHYQFHSLSFCHEEVVNV